MSWKEFFLQFAHDYKPVVIAFITGWHLKRPKYMDRSKDEPTP